MLSNRLKKANLSKIDDSNPDLEIKGSNLVFGLNTGVKVGLIGFKSDGGKDGAEAHCFVYNLLVKGTEVRSRIYDVDKVYSKGSLVTEDSDGYEDLYIKEINQRLSTILHMVKSVGVTQEQVDEALEDGYRTFKEYCEILEDLTKKVDLKEARVDAFLQYQYKIGKGQKKTYLELPVNMYSGSFLKPAVAGDWKEVRDDSGLKYVNSEGEEHPIKKSLNFLQSKNASQQEAGSTRPSGGAMASNKSTTEEEDEW